MEEEVDKPDTGTDKPVFDESDIVQQPSDNNSSTSNKPTTSESTTNKPTTTKPTTSQTTVTEDSSKTNSSVSEIPVLDESDIVSDPQDKEEIEVDMDWLSPEVIASENSNTVENSSIAESQEQNVDDSRNANSSEKTEKIDEKKNEKTNKLPLYAAAAAGTTAAAGGASVFVFKFRKRKW